MYKKGAVLELQFSPSRLNDGAGEPFWIDLSREEATELLHVLQQRLDGNVPEGAPPAVVSLDATDVTPRNTVADETPADPRTASAQEPPADTFRQWICIICGWVYDEAEGLPEEGIAPGTRWEDVPDDWRCPLCDVGKEDFAMVPV